MHPVSDLLPSAHVDTFTRDRLPPPAARPLLSLDDPALPRYPERLNCAAELLSPVLARSAPDRPAFHAEDGTVWSYGELRARVDAIAHVLVEELGVVPGNRVLLRGPTEPWLAACWLAVVKAGAVAVTVLPQARASELAVMGEIARVRHALCHVDARAELDRARLPGLRVLDYGGDAPGDLSRRVAARMGGPGFRAVATSADDVALLAFTSGTTGRPKGCLHFHRDVLAIADTFAAHVLRPGPEDVFAGSPPLGFTFGLGGLVVFPLRCGASALLMDRAVPGRLLPALARHRVSVLFTAPTAYRAMLEALREPAGRALDLSALRLCVSAGESLPAATWRAWRERTGLRIVDGIGATELLHIFISDRPEDSRPGRTGRPVPGWTARVVDAAGRPVPDGTPGLLAVRGPVGCRYLDDPRQAEYVRGGWNLTGDTYVREADGRFRYVARADDMIVSAGYNIAGPEVEEALLRHPDVAEAAVVGLPDVRRGQVVVAYAVARAGVRAPGEAELRRHMEAELAPYKCPRRFVFVPELPRTNTGKLQRHRLREAACESPLPG
ncbi:AMP-binding protein [Streptomyces sp. BI20]|uniref:AMP-binding protein n=1 Tax=Streptomyces sp. BI20 TaxID=3403460 RepID=UPI003C78D632